MAVKVSAKVLETLEEIREEGATNMLDWRTVQYLADKMGCFETVMWIQDNSKDYCRGVFEGFEAESN